MKFDLTVSIVLYNNSSELVNRAIQSLFSSGISFKLYLIDNSPSDHLRELATDSRIEYIFNNENIGFGAGHNIVLRKIIDHSKYHLVLNPDIYFESKVLPILLNFITHDRGIGLAMPMVNNFNAELQYLCKRLPTPIDLILRRFGGTLVERFTRKRTEYYEMRDMDYKEIFIAPYLSGCFMLIKLEVLKEVGLFDERFFMYLEDVDLSRRISQNYKAVYYPKVEVFHGHAKASYDNLKLLAIHISSAIKYFNKWGWFFDSERKRLNKKIEYYNNTSPKS